MIFGLALHLQPPKKCSSIAKFSLNICLDGQARGIFARCEMCKNIGHVHTLAQSCRQVVQLRPGSLEIGRGQQNLFFWGYYHLGILPRSITAFTTTSQSCPTIETCPGGSSSSTTAPGGTRSASKIKYRPPRSKTGPSPSLSAPGLARVVRHS